MNKIKNLCPEKFNPHAVIMLNKSGEVVFYNDKIKEILKKINIKNGIKRFVPDDIGKIVKEIRGKKKSIFKKEVVVKNSIFIEFIFLSGNPELVTIYLDDITEKKKTEELLSFNKIAIDNARDGVMLLDDTGKIVYVNNAFVKMTGYSMDEILSMEIFEIDPGFHKSDWEGHQKKKKEKGSLFFEAFHRAKNGKTYPVEVSASYLNYNGKDYSYSIIRDITERKKMENDILSRKKQYKELLEFLPQPVFEVDLKGNFTFVNKIGMTALGYSENEFKKGINIMNVVVPADRSIIEKKIKELRNEKKEKSSGIEISMRKKDGTTFPIMSFSSRIIKNKKTVGVRGVAFNISEEKKMMEKLILAEEKYRKIFENATEGIVQTTPEGKLMAANPAFFRMLGYSPKENVAVFSSLEKQLYKKSSDRTIFKKIIEKYGKIEGFEFAAKKKNGEKMWISVNAKAVKSKNGEVSFYEGTIVDVTRRKEAETKLIDSEKKFRSLVENIKDVIYSVNRKGIITYVNDSIKLVTGYNADEIIGKPISNLVHPDDLAIYNYVFNNGNENSCEIRIITKKGEVRWVRNRGGVFSSKSGKDSEVQGIIADITDRKKTENQLIDSYKHLGFFNRQVSILSKLNEVNDFGSVHHILNNILVSSAELFGADASLLYKCEKNHSNCELLSFIGMSKKQTRIIKDMFSQNSEITKSLKEKKSQIFGATDDYAIGNITGLKNLKYFHAIPIVKNNNIEAFILMLLEKRKDILHMDFFGEIFSFQVRLILENLKII